MKEIVNAKQFKELWEKTYNTKGKPDWSHILPYYDYNIYFKDCIQEISGIEGGCKTIAISCSPGIL